MIIYSIIIFLLWFFAHKYDGKKISGKVPYILIWFFLILLVGCQYKMGGDNLSYEESFENMAHLGQISSTDFQIGSRYQPLWILFVGLIKSINDSYTCFHLIHALFINTIIAILFYKSTNSKFTASLLFFITLDFFYFNIEIQRESLAITMFCIASYSLLKKRYLEYYILSVIAFLFHASAAILLIIPPIYILFDKGKIKTLFIILITGLLGLTIIKEYLLGLGFDVIENINRQASYYGELDANRKNVLLVALFTCVPYLIFIFLRKFDTTKSKFFLFCTILYCAFTISNVFDSISYRFCNYIFPFVLIYIATVSRNASPQYKKIVFLAYILLVVAYVYKYTRPAPFIGPDAKIYEMYIPYKSILFN